MAQSEHSSVQSGERGGTLRGAGASGWPLCRPPPSTSTATTLAIAAGEISRAGAAGVDLVVFPESFVPGYPDWVWRLNPWSDADWYARFQDQAVEFPGPTLEPVVRCGPGGRHLGRTRRHRADGPRARSTTRSSTSTPRATSPDCTASSSRPAPNDSCGATAHGACSPRSTSGASSRLAHLLGELHAAGPGRALRAGHRRALAPTWDNSEEWVATLRHIAKEGRFSSSASPPACEAATSPTTSPTRDEIYGGDDDLMSRATPRSSARAAKSSPDRSSGEGGILSADARPRAASAAGRAQFDPVGHYARPDVLSLTTSAGGETD